MQFQTFEWDEVNADHIARHGLEPHEVEAACRGDILVLRGRESRYVAYGRTGEGRYVFMVFRALGGGGVRVITARDMTQQEHRLYQRRRH